MAKASHFPTPRQPHPFIHGCSVLPRLTYRSNLHRGGVSAAAEESLRLEVVDGSGAALLPTMLRRLCTVLREKNEQFEISGLVQAASLLNRRKLPQS